MATFATRAVSVAERRDWFEQFSSTGPHRIFVARRGDQILGYASSQLYRDHEAFRETVEVSIVLRVHCRGQGVGTALYRALFDGLAREQVHVVLAGIALPNDASVALRRKFGFTEVGTFREYAGEERSIPQLALDAAPKPLRLDAGRPQAAASRESSGS